MNAKIYGDAAESKVRMIRATLACLGSVDLAQVPSEMVNSDELRKGIGNCAALSDAVGHPAHFNQVLNKAVAALSKQATPILQFLFVLNYADALDRAAGDVDETSDQIKSRMSKDLETLEALKASAEDNAETINGLIQQSRDLLAATVAEREKGIFEEAAEQARKASNGWLISGAVFAVLTLLTAVFLVHDPTLFGAAPSMSTAGQVQSTISRVLLLSLLTSGAAFSAKNYFANRHNFVVNTHRANALAVFHAVFGASEDAATKDAVLLEMTRALFAPQGTGFSKVNDASPTSIVEIVRGLGGRE